MKLPLLIGSLLALAAVACAKSKPLNSLADGGAGTPGAPFGGSAGSSGAPQALGGGGGVGGSGGAGGEPDPVCAPPTPGSECGLVPLCGCEANENCTVFDTASGETVCTIAGTISEKHACFGSGSCAAGMECVGGTCARYCATHADCAPNAECVDVVSGTTPIPGLKTCTSACALEDPSSCGPGIGCFLLESTLTDCRPAGTSTTTCVDLQDCAPGYICLSDGSCARWCRADAPACPSGTSCQTGTAAVIVGGVVYGVCL